MSSLTSRTSAFQNPNTLICPHLGYAIDDSYHAFYQVSLKMLGIHQGEPLRVIKETVLTSSQFPRLPVGGFFESTFTNRRVVHHPPLWKEVFSRNKFGAIWYENSQIERVRDVDKLLIEGFQNLNSDLTT
ncbi:MAG: hypothetical protein Ct9H300mP11_24850 [Chloroflexota bacterium]|nr:MAG: hypothetical protein Ct9H300mP11_24850 [Chloroflexota bacterium]